MFAKFVKGDPDLVVQFLESVDAKPENYIENGNSKDLLEVLVLAHGHEKATGDRVGLGFMKDKFILTEAIFDAYEVANAYEKEALEDLYNTRVCSDRTVSNKFKGAISELNDNFGRYANLLEKDWNNSVEYSDDVKLKFLEALDFDSLMAVRNIDGNMAEHNDRGILDSFINWVISLIFSNQEIAKAFVNNIVTPLVEVVGKDSLDNAIEQSSFERGLESEKLVEKLANVSKSQGREI